MCMDGKKILGKIPRKSGRHIMVGDRQLAAPDMKICDQAIIIKMAQYLYTERKVDQSTES